MYLVQIQPRENTLGFQMASSGSCESACFILSVLCLCNSAKKLTEGDDAKKQGVRAKKGKELKVLDLKDGQNLCKYTFLFSLYMV